MDWGRTLLRVAEGAIRAMDHTQVSSMNAYLCIIGYEVVINEQNSDLRVFYTT
jgi:hypothetical protein